MLEVFDPVPWSTFCEKNIDRLTLEDLARDLVIRFRWIGRQLCVTSVSSLDHTTPAANWALDLRIAAGEENGARLWTLIRDFAEAEVKRQHANHPFFERVVERGRVHLARPMRSVALCHKRVGPHSSPTSLDLTCHVCIRRASGYIHRKDPDYARIALTQAERKRARLPLERGPAWDLLDAAMEERFERARGGPT